MSEGVISDSNDQQKTTSSFSSSVSLYLQTMVESFEMIFLSTNKRHFLLLFLLFSLPLSLLLFCLSLSTLPTHSHILHLESLAIRSHTRFEARQVWKESRSAALSLLHLKLIYFFPTYFLSLIASISSVVSADAGFNRRPITLSSSLALSSTWARPLLTSILIYAILMLYAAVPRVLTAVIGAHWLSIAIWVLGWGLEVYVAAVLGLGLVVSILEKRLGLDAIWVGWEMMEGRGVCGMLLSASLELPTLFIRWRMESAVELEKVVLLGLYGVLLLWGFVVYTVFYSHCKKDTTVAPSHHPST